MKVGGKAKCTAFEGTRCIASGELIDVALATKAAIDRGTQEPVLLFDDRTSELIEVDFRGTAAEVRARLYESMDSHDAPAPEPEERPTPRGPGRPKLGVVGREVTLLPRHWEWLNEQPGGASVALRKLVERARRENQEPDRLRQAQESANRFLTAMAGDLPHYEEATRALFALNPSRFEEMIAPWPSGVRDHATKLAARVFGRPSDVQIEGGR